MISVYGICGADGKICYVGETQRSLEDRAKCHLKADNKTRICRWLKRHPEARFFLIEANAILHETERRLIAWYRAHGAELLNSTDGGDGNHGYRWTDQQKAMISKVRKGRIITPEWRAAISRGSRGKPKPPGFGEKVSRGRMGIKHSDATRAKIGAASRGRRFKMPEEAKKKIAAAKRVWWTPERRREQATRQILANQNWAPEILIRAAEKRRATWARKRKQKADAA